MEGNKSPEAIKQELFRVLKEHGAVLCGAADMKGISPEGLETGISVAVPVPKSIVRDLKTAPTEEYLRAYESLNSRLNGIVTAGAEYLRQMGYRALPNTTDRVTVNEERCSPIPHKTFAVRAGLGWIGRNCLLITPEYGGAVRLSSLLTDAPLPTDEPCTESRCGDCRLCADACPAHALTGALWQPGMPRAELLDQETCYACQLDRMETATGIRSDLCGLCFAVCPYTENYIK